MGFFAATITLFVIVLLALFVNRIATVALTFTGLSREMARFQARSAFSTVGFTTTESEGVVNHPVRRRIIAILMLLGNAGFIGIIATVLGSFTGESERPLAVRLGILVAGLAGLWALAMSKWVDDLLFRVIGWALRRWTHIEVHDFLDLLHLGEGFSVTELLVEPGDWLAGYRLDELRLGDVGVNVLSIERSDAEFVGAPVGGTYVRKGDKLTVYGARESIIALDEGKSDPEQEKKHKGMLAEIRALRAKEDREQDTGYSVTELQVEPQDWLVGKPLSELRLADLGVIVLGIQRADKGEYVGSPKAGTLVLEGDELVVYGAREDIVALDECMDKPEEAEELYKRCAAVRIQREQEEGERVLRREDGGGDAAGDTAQAAS